MRKLLIIDTETTAKNQSVADFGAVLVDLSKPRGADGYGQVIRELGSYVYGEFDRLELWHDPFAPPESFWSKLNVAERQKAQESEVKDGNRNIAAANWINHWLAEIADEFAPICTAYNWRFDRDVCRRTGINIDQFQHGMEWCLWGLAKRHYATDPAYTAHCIANDYMTPKGRIQFTADSVSNFIFWQRGNVEDPEPHTALEDAKIYELPIAQELFRHGLLDVLKSPTEGTDNATPEN
jgi:hypothetical protein